MQGLQLAFTRRVIIKKRIIKCALSFFCNDEKKCALSFCGNEQKALCFFAMIKKFRVVFFAMMKNSAQNLHFLQIYIFYKFTLFLEKSLLNLTQFFVKICLLNFLQILRTANSKFPLNLCIITNHNKGGEDDNDLQKSAQQLGAAHFL